MSRGRNWLRVVAIGAGVLTLTLVLVALRFPWDRFTPMVEEVASQAAGRPIQIERIEIALSTIGPSLVASGVSVPVGPGPPIRFDVIYARPAFAFDWLQGAPLFRLRATGPALGFDGLAGTLRITGRAESADVMGLPWPGSPMANGAVTANLDLRFEASTLIGSASLEGRDGALFPPSLPVAVPYDRLTGELVLSTAGIELAPLRLEGPMLTAHTTGNIQIAAGGAASAGLALEVLLERVDPTLASLAGAGGQSLAAGRRLTVSGTASRPIVR